MSLCKIWYKHSLILRLKNVLYVRVKRENSIRQIERAHCNIYSRVDLIMMAINVLWIDDITPIKVGDILKLFIQKHEICQFYMLCNICHNKYDN